MIAPVLIALVLIALAVIALAVIALVLIASALIAPFTRPVFQSILDGSALGRFVRVYVRF